MFCDGLQAKIKNSISAKFLVTFLFLLIIPLFIAVQLFVNRLHTVLKNKEQAYITEKVSYAQTQFDRIFSDMDRIAVSLILDYHVTDILSDSAAIPTYEWFTGYKTLNSLLSLLHSNADYRYSITISGYDNKLYQAGAVYNSMIKSDDPLLARIREGNGNPVICNRILEGLDDNPVVTLGRSVYRNGKYLGSILVDVPIVYMDALLNPFESDTTQMYVLEEDQKIIYASRSLESPDILPTLREAAKKHSSSIQYLDTEYLFSRMPTKQSGLCIVTLVTVDSVFWESSQAVFAFVFAFSVMILAAIIGIFFLTYTFTRDIRALNAAVTEFGNDPQKVISLPVRSGDEAGQLTQGFLSMSCRIRKLLHKVQENEEKKRILEFNSLQAQINPHMIYNTLNTITYMAQIQNVRNIEEVSSSFAHLLRSISNQGAFITIAQEVAYLRSFIAVKKYNLLCTIETDFCVEKEAANCKILKLLLQPIVENAVIHGFYGRTEDGLLCVTVRRKENKIYVSVSDDGNGMDEEQVQHILKGEVPQHNTFLRVGMKNIMDRLLLQYGSKASFSIASAPGCGTTVHLCFPAEEMETTDEL